MSVLYTEITLRNEIDAEFAKRGLIGKDEIRQMTVEAVVDSGAWSLVISEETRARLGLEVSGEGEATLADGQEGVFPMAGPLELWWKNRRLVLDALVMPSAKETLLGAWPLEGLDLTINPKREIVGVHGDVVKYRV